MWRRVRLLAVCVALRAHDIKGDVKVEAYLKPEASTMHVVVRGPMTVHVEKLIELYEDGARVADPTIVGTKMSADSDRSFVSYRDALTHVMEAPEPVSHVTQPPEAARGDVLDVAIEYPIRSAQSEFSIRPGFDKLGMKVVTVLWFLPPEGTVRAFEYTGDAGLVRLDPSWHQAALTFVRLGFFHILDGTDHLLFLFALVIPFRKLRPLLWIVTSFTVAHSITLIASAFNLAPSAAWFPPLIEVLIATSIVYMALENIVGVKGVRPHWLTERWAITFAFGLVHGFGFSFALHETLQFAGAHLVTSLLAFNVGVEIGQVLVLGLLVPLLALLFRYVVAERMGTIILSAFIAHTGWHWMLERLQALAF